MRKSLESVRSALQIGPRLALRALLHRGRLPWRASAGATGRARRGVARRGRAGRILACLGGAVAVLAVPYAASVVVTWLGYGRAKRDGPEGERDPLLDRFIPSYDVAERHQVRVAASAEIAYAAARDLDLQRSGIVRTIFRGRELIMRGEHVEPEAPSTFLAQAQRLGWRALAEVPGREIVLGAVTRPWEANVRFEGLPPDELARFDAPRYVKIVWNFAVDPLSPEQSLVRTETRVATTDDYARKRFRRYWAVFSPGILLIRREALRLVKADAERRARARATDSSRAVNRQVARPR